LPWGSNTVYVMIRQRKHKRTHVYIEVFFHSFSTFF
jgi:hypothetical protein